MNRNKFLIQLAGLLFIFGGIVLYLFISHPLPGKKDWKIEVSGTERLQQNEIKELVLYIIRSSEKSISAQELENAIALNPFVKNVNVKLNLPRTVLITIEETQATYYSQESGQLREYDSEGKLLEENVQKIFRKEFSEIPIFYLTDQSRDIKSSLKLQRDIIQLWQETREEYGFLWQRISEIEIRTGENKKNVEPVFYATGARARVIVQMPVSRKLLLRLWGTFYYLENTNKTYWLDVMVREQDAIVKRIR